MLFIETDSHSVFIQDPDHKFPATLFFAFLFKELQHFGTGSQSHKAGININKMKFIGILLIFIIRHANPHHAPDDPGVGIFVNIYSKALFFDPAPDYLNAILDGQVPEQTFIRNYIFVRIPAAENFDLSDPAGIIHGCFTDHSPSPRFENFLHYMSRSAAFQIFFSGSRHPRIQQGYGRPRSIDSQDFFSQANRFLLASFLIPENDPKTGMEQFVIAFL